jgi:prevent-host-death family protein
MSLQQQVSQRDLRTRSKEIMDAVEHGESFTVTRDGRGIGQLIPLRGPRRFASRAEFAALSRSAPAISLERLRLDQAEAFDETIADPYAR